MNLALLELASQTRVRSHLRRATIACRPYRQGFLKKPSFERLYVNIIEAGQVRHFVGFAELLLSDPELNVIRDANTISSNAASLDKISLTE